MKREEDEFRRYYECRDCSHRITAESHRARCSRCDGQLRNIGVPRGE